MRFPMNKIHPMKRLSLFFSLIVIAACSCAQSKVPTALPPYHILTVDSTYATPANLKKNEPVMVIYFQPDCGHCQRLMYEMKPVMKDFKHVQVVMITFAEPLKATQVFYRDFNLAKYPNFTVGTEGHSITVLRYYNVQMTPFIALYNKQHQLVKSYSKAPDVKELGAEAEKL